MCRTSLFSGATHLLQGWSGSARGRNRVTLTGSENQATQGKRERRGTGYFVPWRRVSKLQIGEFERPEYGPKVALLTLCKDARIGTGGEIA